MAVAAGAEAIGFIFATSKREVSARQAHAITSHLAPSVETVGVFTSTDADFILNTAIEANVSTVQLHSRHSAELVRAVQAGSGWKLRVLQVVQVPAEWTGTAAAELETNLRAAASSTVNLLLDTAVAGTSGGTGIPFAWERAAHILDKLPRSEWRIGLAGGLRAENVREAVAALQPDFVDVVSGVEARPGQKDPERLRDFFVQVAKRKQ